MPLGLPTNAYSGPTLLRDLGQQPAPQPMPLGTSSLRDLGQQSAPAWTPNQNDLRSNGTQKGTGWLGVLKRPNGGVSTELSIGVNMDGKEQEIPLLVPTLSPEEVNWLLTNNPDPNTVPQPIVDKAVSHAKQRMGAGFSPFKN